MPLALNRIVERKVSTGTRVPCGEYFVLPAFMIVLQAFPMLNPLKKCVLINE